MQLRYRGNGAMIAGATHRGSEIVFQFNKTTGTGALNVSAPAPRLYEYTGGLGYHAAQIWASEKLELLGFPEVIWVESDPLREAEDRMLATVARQLELTKAIGFVINAMRQMHHVPDRRAMRNLRARLTEMEGEIK